MLRISSEKMNLMKEGYVGCIKKMQSLKKGWDGYNAKPIRKKVLKRFSDMTYMDKVLGIFRKVGFKDSDIYVVPCLNGTIQLEAESKNIYLEVVIR